MAAVPSGLVRGLGTTGPWIGLGEINADFHRWKAGLEGAQVYRYDVSDLYGFARQGALLCVLAPGPSSLIDRHWDWRNWLDPGRSLMLCEGVVSDGTLQDSMFYLSRVVNPPALCLKEVIPGFSFATRRWLAGWRWRSLVVNWKM